MKPESSTVEVFEAAGGPTASEGSALAYVLRKIAQPVAAAAVFLLAWEILVRAYQIKPAFLPPPSAILLAMAAQWEILLKNAVPTALESLGGFVLSVVVGVMLGALLTFSRASRDYLYPNVVLFQLVPKVAVAPLFMLWLGIDWQSRVAIAFFIAFFPIVISTVSGLNAVDPTLLRLFRSLTANEWQVFMKVRVPMSLPFVFNGMKISMTLAIIGVIVGEFVTSQRGLGYIILFAGSRLETALVLAAILVLCIVGLLLYGIVALAEHLIMKKYGA
ncbi:MAG: ABC transporter permease [Betaproteobacteria bacterium]|nr:ABC transporter permease [Pseudomonadota bacterium]